MKDETGHESALIRVIQVGTAILQEFPYRSFTARELAQRMPVSIPLSTLYRYLLLFERENVIRHEGCQYTLNQERYRALLRKNA